MEIKIPTAEEFAKQFRKTNPIAEAESIEHWMGQHCIEFAKLHVEQALEAASENVGLSYKNSILNAYPLTNIK
jgi:hypothetical protein